MLFIVYKKFFVKRIAFLKVQVELWKLQVDLIQCFAERNFQFTVHAHDIPTIFVCVARIEPEVQKADYIHFVDMIVPPSSLLLLCQPELLAFYISLHLYNKRSVVKYTVGEVLLSLFSGFRQ